MQMPNVLQYARPKTRAVFWYLVRSADKNGLVPLHADAIASALGISRRTVYYSLSFLRKCKLAAVTQALLGRGKHSTLKVLWSSRTQSVHCIREVKRRNTLSGERDHRYAMHHFRVLLNQSLLFPSEVRRCLQVIGKRIKGKGNEYKDLLWKGLQERLQWLSTPRRCWDNPQHIYAWFGAVVKSIYERVPTIR